MCRRGFAQPLYQRADFGGWRWAQAGLGPDFRAVAAAAAAAAAPAAVPAWSSSAVRPRGLPVPSASRSPGCSASACQAAAHLNGVQQRLRWAPLQELTPQEAEGEQVGQSGTLKHQHRKVAWLRNRSEGRRLPPPSGDASTLQSRPVRHTHENLVQRQGCSASVIATVGSRRVRFQGPAHCKCTQKHRHRNSMRVAQSVQGALSGL